MPETLFPVNEPYQTNMVDVGQGHSLYVAQFGNPEGKPVTYIHGGPGAGHAASWQKYFNPEFYRIILFDQRGAGKSTPSASVEHNTIDHLVGDIETIRKNLGVDKWIVGGGSWGSTLALLYARDHPEHVISLILRGIFFGTKQGAAHIAEEGGAQPLEQKYFDEYRDHIPGDIRARGGLIAAYDRIMKTGTPAEQREGARLFMSWDTSIAFKDVETARAAVAEVNSNPVDEIPCTKIFMHYALHEFRDEMRDLILRQSPQLRNIPMYIIHGVHDRICPMENAQQLHAAYPHSTLYVCDDAGHSGMDGSIPEKHIRVTEFIRHAFG